MTGSTSSSDFPVVHPLQQPRVGQAEAQMLGGPPSDASVARIKESSQGQAGQTALSAATAGAASGESAGGTVAAGLGEAARGVPSPSRTNARSWSLVALALGIAGAALLGLGMLRQRRR